VQSKDRQWNKRGSDYVEAPSIRGNLRADFHVA
jgi:hypothetical protein